MNQDKAIKILAILNLLLLPIAVGMSFYLESYLPPLLVNYLEQEWESEMGNLDLAIFLVAIPALALHTIALFGVLFLQKWSRKVLLLSSAALYFLLPFLGPYVDHGLPAALDGLLSCLLGALLALLYFGKSAFNKSMQPIAKESVD